MFFVLFCHYRYLSPPLLQVYNLLLGLLGRAKLYVDVAVHGTTKLVQYFSFMTYCLISKTEKLMFSSFFMDLWNLFQVRRDRREPTKFGFILEYSDCVYKHLYSFFLMKNSRLYEYAWICKLGMAPRPFCPMF